MKLELILLLILIAIIYNTYYDGYLIDRIKIDMKYFKIALYLSIGLFIYFLLKKQPLQTRSLLIHANDIIKYMPIDKNSKNMISPILDYTKNKFFTDNCENGCIVQDNKEGFILSRNPQNDINKRMLNSGKNTTNNFKRSVSETKKKYVASNQSWKCGHCNQPLDHTYEVDHIMDLQYGGDNNVQNLIALCRNCHGKKTVQLRL